MAERSRATSQKLAGKASTTTALFSISPLDGHSRLLHEHNPEGVQC